MSINQAIVASLFPQADPPAGEPGAPEILKIRGSVIGGKGGKGFTDTIGLGELRDLGDEDPIQQGEILGTVIFEGGNGGPGGLVSARAASYDFLFDFNVGRLQGGAGGEGGDCGPAKAQDGTASGQAGESVESRTGNGGNGGNVAISAAQLIDSLELVDANEASRAGAPGDSGSSFVSAGNGGPGARGGDLLVLLGALGEKGTVPIPDGELILPKQASIEIAILNGGNGGADLEQGPGEGGEVSVDFSDKLRSTDISFRSENYGNGGKGANICPFQGERGGDGGTLNFFRRPGPNDNDFSFYPTMVIFDSFNGGMGGDGEPSGLGGDAGMSNVSTAIFMFGIMPDIRNSFQKGVKGGPCDTPGGSFVDLNPGLPGSQDIWDFDFSTGNCPVVPDLRLTPAPSATGFVDWKIEPLSTWGSSPAITFPQTSGTVQSGTSLDIPVDLSCPDATVEEVFEVTFEYDDGNSIVEEVVTATYRGTREDPPPISVVTDVELEVRNQSNRNREFILASGDVPLHDATILFLPPGNSLVLNFTDPLDGVQLFINLKPPGLQIGRDIPAGAPLSPGLGETGVFIFTGTGEAGEVETFIEG